ncbi:hypothetical protein Poly30_20370 [Planctomycetes bacterium Poly30]|uniref:Uncharacterized protein n=1 Tax=Saltatorellus ferox TaxID=2528018 RepID=A0A518ER08_9BACT|nr:hypothetical protein Poly30_20370 [Planctomycetes bacterium Poly30]
MIDRFPMKAGWAPLVAAVALSAGVAVGAPSALQNETPLEDGTQHADSPDSSDAFRLLQERRRDLSHPSDPLKLSGAFEDENNLAANRGAIQRSSFTPVLVDAEAAYERQLAMLEDRATYIGASLPAYRGDDQPQLKAPLKRLPVREEEDPTSSRASWLAAFAVAALGTCALVLQGRK